MTKKFELTRKPQTLEYGKETNASFTQSSVYVKDKMKYEENGTYIPQENAIQLAKDILILYQVPFVNRVKEEKK